MANINDSELVSAILAESADTAEKSALETIADTAEKSELETIDNLESAKEIIHEKAESYQAKLINVNQTITGESGEVSLTDRSVQDSSIAPSTESESESESESHEDSLAFPLAIKSVTFPLSIFAWFSRLCSKKRFMSRSTKPQAPKESVENPNAANEDLADGDEVQAPEELEVSTNAIEPDASGKAVENAMKEFLDVSTSTIEEDDQADADNQIEDTDEPMKESLDVDTNAIIEQDGLENADNETDQDTDKAVEGAQGNMVESLSLQVGKVEDSFGKYKRAIKSQVSTLKDSLGESERAFKSQMNGVEEDANAFKSQASTVEVSVGEAAAAYRSRVEALKIRFESFRN